MRKRRMRFAHSIVLTQTEKRRTIAGRSAPERISLGLPRLRHFLHRYRIEERHLRAEFLAHDLDGVFGFPLIKVRARATRVGTYFST